MILTLKGFILKEMNFIEGFKSVNTKETNPLYCQVCGDSMVRLNLALNTLRKMEDQAVDDYTKSNNEKCKNLLKNIIGLNNDIFKKSSDSPNLVDQLKQVNKNKDPLKGKEKDLAGDDGKPIDEKYVSSIMDLFKKSPIDDEVLCHNIIKTLTPLAEAKPENCDKLSDENCPKILLQILDNTNNKNLADDALNLLNLIVTSNDKNLQKIGQQSDALEKILRAGKKFGHPSFVKCSRNLANWLKKVKGKVNVYEQKLKNALDLFHKNLKKIIKISK